MKHLLKTISAVGILSLALISQGVFAKPSSNQANTPIIITPDKIQWIQGPGILPPGAAYAVLEGSLNGKENLTLRVKLPPNYQVKSHFVSALERVTVLSGSINVGTGDKFDLQSGTSLPAGSFIVMPANKHYYVWTSSEETIIQISAQGPWSVTYVNPNDDPRKNIGSSKPLDNMTSPANGSIAPATQTTQPATQAPSDMTIPSTTPLPSDKTP